MTRYLRPFLTLAGTAVAGAVVTVVITGTAPRPPVMHHPRLSTAIVRRTDLATTVLTEGTLGYAPSPPVVNEAPGTYTALPTVGSAIGIGEVLYRVDDVPVILMQGATPAWRALSVGITHGPDVAELQSTLITLGYASGLVTAPDGKYATATATAVERWQAANGITPTGVIPFGEVVFLPGPIVVGTPDVALGQPASPGQVPYVATTAARQVTVPLNPNLPAVSPGEAVSIVLPSGAMTPGQVARVGPAAALPAGSGAATSSAGSASLASVAIVSPDDSAATGSGTGVPVQVSLTSQVVHHVLAVPIAALLALAGGGYGVEVVRPNDAHHLVQVNTGVFAGPRVQVTGRGIAVGTRVVVAQ